MGSCFTTSSDNIPFSLGVLCVCRVRVPAKDTTKKHRNNLYQFIAWQRLYKFFFSLLADTFLVNAFHIFFVVALCAIVGGISDFTREWRQMNKSISVCWQKSGFVICAHFFLVVFVAISIFDDCVLSWLKRFQRAEKLKDNSI